jgi:hypothetical protein
VVKMGDFEFDIALLISLVEARPVFWDKMDDIYKDKNESKKAWREVFIFKKTSRLLMLKKTLLVNIVIIY